MTSSFYHRFIALVLLTAYGVSGTSILPAVVSAVAWLDGSHSVVVKQSEKGPQVFLQHQAEHYTPKVEDHQTALARILVSMCESSDAGDHQITTGEITGGVSLPNQSDLRIDRVSIFCFRETHFLSLENRWSVLDSLRDRSFINRSSLRVQPWTYLATIRLMI